MSVAENILMNRRPTNKFGQTKWNKLYKVAEELLRKFKLQVEPIKMSLCTPTTEARRR